MIFTQNFHMQWISISTNVTLMHHKHSYLRNNCQSQCEVLARQIKAYSSEACGQETTNRTQQKACVATTVMMSYLRVGKALQFSTE